MAGDEVNVRSFDQKKLDQYRDQYDYTKERKRQRELKKQQALQNGNNNTSGSNNNSGNNFDPNRSAPRPVTPNSGGNGSGGGNVNSGGSGGGGGARSGGGGGSGGNPLLYVLFGLVIIGVAFAVVASRSGGFSFVKKNKPQKDNSGDEDIIEDIHKMDILTVLEKAILNGEYRRATRLMYLDILKSLSLKGMIFWEENKTNRDYLYEIKNRDLRKSFDDATLLYEYVWYGKVDIQQDQFDQVHTKFKSLLKKIG